MKIHVVKKGETVLSIARQYGVSPGLLQRQNQVPPDGALVPGQTLVVQEAEKVHTVARGDTVWSIARRYGITARALYQNNIFLQGQRRLQPGEELVISFRDGGKAGPLGVNGYAYPFINGDLLRQALPYLTYVTPFTYGIGPEGEPVPLRDEGILAAAGQYGVLPWMHLSSLTEEGWFSSSRAETLLKSSHRQEALLEQIKEILKEKGYGGVDVDFEYLQPGLAGAYTAFIERLRQELNKLGYTVQVALAPKVSRGQKGLLYESHDYAALGRAANGALLMTYEWGYTYGPPMAVAPIGAVRRVVEYALTQIPASKILLGFPNYAYDWTLPYAAGESRARSLGNEAAAALAVQVGAEICFDEAAQTPYFSYTDRTGAAHEVWFEDPRSCAAKYDLAQEYSLRGFGFWNFMRPFTAAFALLNARFTILPGV